MNETKQIRKQKYLHFLSKCRLLYKSVNEHDIQIDNAIQNVHTYVLAPTLNVFTIWLLKNALLSGVEVLYFLARDGYLMYLTAKEYCAHYNLPIVCKYLYCSRYSLRIPLYHKNHAEALEHICRGGIDVSLRKIMQRSGFKDDQIGRLYPIFADRYDLYKAIPYAELKQVQADLECCAEYLNELDKSSKAAWPELCHYFEQEGLLEEKHIAIVDSGWTGTTQKTISDVLQFCGRKSPIEGYYFGLYEVPQHSNRASYHTFYFSPYSSLQRKVFFSNCLFEAVFSAPHGTTLGYENQGNLYSPITQNVNQKYCSYFNQLQNDILCVTENVLTYMRWEQIDDKALHQMASVVNRLLRLFMWKPLPDEVEWFGRLRFSDDLLDDHSQELAVYLTENQLRENHVFHKVLLMLGVHKGSIHESAWFEGSVVRNGRHCVWHRTNYALYKAMVYLKKTLGTIRGYI